MIAFPIRLNGAGSLAVVGDDSSTAATQLAHAVVSTRVGERPLAPAYGIPDPTDGADPGVIAALVALCEPELTVTNVRTGDSRVEVDVEWSQ